MSKSKLIFLVLGLIFTLSILIFSLVKKNYKIYLISETLNYKPNTKIIINGKTVGVLENVTPLNDSTTIAALEINGGTKIPGKSKQRYFENLFGDGFISFEPTKENTSYIQQNDTLFSRHLILNNQDTLFRVIKQGIQDLNKKLESIHKDTLNK